MILLKLLINHLKIKIMNLENLNLVELNAQEVEETDGGGWRAQAAFLVCDTVFGVIPGAFMRLGYELG